MGHNRKAGGLVYSTDQGRMCPACARPQAQCICSSHQSPIKGDGIVRVGRETKGRKGKGVTTISGIPLAGAELKAFVAQLKKKCGTGGALKNGVAEIQGDHRDTLLEELRKQGWTVKRSGA